MSRLRPPLLLGVSIAVLDLLGRIDRSQLALKINHCLLTYFNEALLWTIQINNESQDR